MPLLFDKILSVELGGSWPRSKYSQAADWLKDNTPKNSIVLHSDWDEWPPLFYHGDHNYYIIGLDPTFMYNHDQELYQIYSDITNGNVSANLAGQINYYFGAKFIIVDKDRSQSKFIDNLINDKRAVQIYEDDEVRIFALKI